MLHSNETTAADAMNPVGKYKVLVPEPSRILFCWFSFTWTSILSFILSRLHEAQLQKNIKHMEIIVFGAVPDVGRL